MSWFFRGSRFTFFIYFRKLHSPIFQKVSKHLNQTGKIKLKTKPCFLLFLVKLLFFFFFFFLVVRWRFGKGRWVMMKLKNKANWKISKIICNKIKLSINISFRQLCIIILFISNRFCNNNWNNLLKEFYLVYIGFRNLKNICNTHKQFYRKINRLFGYFVKSMRIPYVHCL